MLGGNAAMLMVPPPLLTVVVDRSSAPAAVTLNPNLEQTPDSIADVPVCLLLLSCYHVWSAQCVTCQNVQTAASAASQAANAFSAEVDDWADDIRLLRVWDSCIKFAGSSRRKS